jgi:hypothetical protein
VRTARTLHDLCTYEHGVRTRRPGFVEDNANRHKLAREILDKVAEGHFVVEPVDPQIQAKGFVFVDRGPSMVIESLCEVRDQTREARRAFAAEHAETLAGAARAAVMDRYRAAVGGNDPAELAAALRKLPAIPNVNTLTTDDF